MENSIAMNSLSSRGICHHLQAVLKGLLLDPADPADLKVVVLAVADRTLVAQVASVAQASVAQVAQASAAQAAQASADGVASVDPVRKDAANPAGDPNALSDQNSSSLPFANIKNSTSRCDRSGSCCF